MSNPEDMFLKEMEEELHDLCQPLTALHFRLEAGKFEGSPEALRESIDNALQEAQRLIDAVRRMRKRIATLRA